MPQTDYSVRKDRGFAGLVARGLAHGVRTGLNENASDQPYGIAVKRGSTERGFDILSAISDRPIAVLAHKHRPTEDDGTTGAPADADNPMVEQGDVWVRCEEAISLGDRVFTRAVTSGEEQAGDFRTDADGDAQVWTVTPTAADSTDYQLDVFAGGKLFSFTVTSDTNATATEICDAFRTAMQADSDFNALVTSSGTSTLVLTSADKSKEFQPVDGGQAGGYDSITETTAAAPDCIELDQAEWLTASITGADGETVALLRLNLPE